LASPSINYDALVPLSREEITQTATLNLKILVPIWVKQTYTRPWGDTTSTRWTYGNENPTTNESNSLLQIQNICHK